MEDRTKTPEALAFTQRTERFENRLGCPATSRGLRTGHATLQADYVLSLIAAVTANTAARVINIHPDNEGISDVTVSVPDAAAPGGASLEVTCDVVLTCAPRAAPRTLTVIVQDWPPASTFDVLEKVSVPGLMEKMPPPVASVLHVPPV